jgi:hypothetical protein
MGDDDSWPGFDGSSMSFPDGRALVDAQPVPDARMFPDSPPPVFPDAPPPVMCGTTSPDLCAAAMDVTAGAMAAGGMTVSGDTTSLMNDLSPPATGCTGFSNPGPDAIFQVTAAAGQTIRATVRPDLWDASVFIASACTSSACVAGADIEIDEPETTSFAVTTAGTYFVVVDSWQASTAGCYELNVALD